MTFIINSGVDDDLRAGRYDVFFRVYNGPAYVQNGYPQAFKINLAKWAKVPVDRVKEFGSHREHFEAKGATFIEAIGMWAVIEEPARPDHSDHVQVLPLR